VNAPLRVSRRFLIAADGVNVSSKHVTYPIAMPASMASSGFTPFAESITEMTPDLE
jgi:hypothetical protein